MLIPHRNKIIVRIYFADRWHLFNQTIKRGDGTALVFAKAIELDDERLDAAYAQNVSVGEVIAVGKNLADRLRVGDIAIIDYLVDNDRDAVVSLSNEYKDVVVWANCLYHEADAPKEANGRRAFYKGEYKRIGQVFGAVRGDSLIAIEPYLFLEHESNVINVFSKVNLFFEETVSVIERKVLASYPGANAQEGEYIVVQDCDIFERVIDNKVVSTIFNIDVKLKKSHNE